jgi:hypothetical protein
MTAEIKHVHCGPTQALASVAARSKARLRCREYDERAAISIEWAG